MHWNVWKDDVGAALKAAAKPKTIILHPMSIELIIGIDDKAQKAISKDRGFTENLKKLCDKISDKAVKEMETTLKKADSQAPGFPEDMIGLFLRPVHITLERSFDEACKKMEKDVARLFSDYCKINEYMKKVAIKVDLDVTFDGIEIPTNKKKTSAGGGVKLAPIEVGDTLTEGSKGLQNFMKQARDEVQRIGVRIHWDLQAFEKKRIGLLGGNHSMATDADDPSSNPLKKETEDLQKLIQLHTANLAKLSETWKALSKIFKDAESENDAWMKKFNAGKASMPPDKVKQITASMKQAEASIDMILKNTVRVSANLKAAVAGAEKFETAFVTATGGKTGWATDSQVGVRLDDQLCASIKDLETVVQQRAHAVNEAEKNIEKTAKP